MWAMQLSDIVIVLCRPQEAGNMGAVCRAMKNMGLSRLRLVSPKNLNDEVTLARCVHAEDIWRGKESFDSLQTAIADCTLTAGTSRRRGAKRKDITLTPHELALYLKQNVSDGAPDSAAGGATGASGAKCAIVFGNERTGLENDELALCNISSHIPANEEFPSLNLSHSVQIYAYELFTALSGEASRETSGAWHPVTREKIDALCSSICQSLSELGFYTHSPAAEHHEYFRDIFSRAQLTEFETAYMHKIFAKAARLAGKSDI
jgi:tRNA/rRNA methyltransferase/tRNA (cytidine32/uridine32-2'-O)-methyltransferase